MGELLERAFTEQRLLDAWREPREAALADGEGGLRVDRCEAAAARHVSELAKALRDGTFRPYPVVRAEVAEHGGGMRGLAVPSLVDRIVERALLAELDRSPVAAGELRVPARARRPRCRGLPGGVP